MSVLPNGAIPRPSVEVRPARGVFGVPSPAAISAHAPSPSRPAEKRRVLLGHPLSSRERECHDLRAAGLRNVEIAARLGISRNSVGAFLTWARRKLGEPAPTRRRAA